MGKKKQKPERDLAPERLSELWQRDLPELPLDTFRYVLVSDLHLGHGGKADDFRRNEATLALALDYYDANRFVLVLLGDTEELWQFDIAEIKARYEESIYRRIRGFAPDRLWRVFGNHDFEWGSPLDPALPDPARTHGVPEGIKLTDVAGRPRILLVHGHQGTHLSDYKSWSSRYWVRMYRKIEPVARFLGLVKNPSLPASPIAKDFERVRYEWAKREGVMLICGHTHRAIFASEPYTVKLRQREAVLAAQLRSDPDNENAAEWRRELREIEKSLKNERESKRDIPALEDDPAPCYFNTGCGLYNGGITAIELDDDEIRLVKWHNDPEREERRELLRPAARLSALLDRL